MKEPERLPKGKAFGAALVGGSQRELPVAPVVEPPEVDPAVPALDPVPEPVPDVLPLVLLPVPVVPVPVVPVVPLVPVPVSAVPVPVLLPVPEPVPVVLLPVALPELLLPVDPVPVVEVPVPDEPVPEPDVVALGELAEPGAPVPASLAFRLQPAKPARTSRSAAAIGKRMTCFFMKTPLGVKQKNQSRRPRRTSRTMP
jgi:hypothetical protein